MEHPVVKVWILLLPKQGIEYMQQALLALLAWSGIHRLTAVKLWALWKPLWTF